MRIAVFGGNGFLGYHLVSELLRRSYKVTVADIQEKDAFQRQVQYVRCDILSMDAVKNVFATNKFDVVYNLAGFSNLEEALEEPIRTMQLNVIGNLHIIESCIEYKVPKYVYASSAYAVSNKGSFYGISKLTSEKLIEEYHKKHGLNFTILRYGSVYSEQNFNNNYIYQIVKSAIFHKRIEHKGDGLEVREYIHAEDVAKLSVDILNSPEFDNTHVMLTGNERLDRKSLFNMIKEILDEPIDIVYENTGYSGHYRYTPYAFTPSVGKKLIANPHIDMGQGILECIRAIYNEQQESEQNT